MRGMVKKGETNLSTTHAEGMGGPSITEGTGNAIHRHVLGFGRADFITYLEEALEEHEEELTTRSRDLMLDDHWKKLVGIIRDTAGKHFFRQPQPAVTQSSWETHFPAARASRDAAQLGDNLCF